MELEGKIINFLGDSITEGVGVTNLNNRYDNRLKRQLHLKGVYNYGIGGTRLAHQSTPSEKPRHDLCFCGRAYDLNPNADITLVYGGVNDYIHGDAPFGNLTDATPATFCGAVDFLMRLLKMLYPEQTVAFLTPAPLNHNGLNGKTPSKLPTKKPDAKPLKDYCEVLMLKGQEYNIPVLHLQTALGIDPNSPAQKQQYTADGLHFNDAGHGVLAQCVAEFLKGL